MSRLIFEVYLILGGVVLFFTGGALVWPIARRVGERRPAPYAWVPIETPTGRVWRPSTPRPTVRTRLAAGWAAWWAPARHRAVTHRMALAARWEAWWASTAPRDPDAAVRAALRGAPADYIGRPPWAA
jgi:hypothetical protein